MPSCPRLYNNLINELEKAFGGRLEVFEAPDSGMANFMLGVAVYDVAGPRDYGPEDANRILDWIEVFGDFVSEIISA